MSGDRTSGAGSLRPRRAPGSAVLPRETPTAAPLGTFPGKWGAAVPDGAPAAGIWGSPRPRVPSSSAHGPANVSGTTSVFVYLVGMWHPAIVNRTSSPDVAGYLTAARVLVGTTGAQVPAACFSGRGGGGRAVQLPAALPRVASARPVAQTRPPSLRATAAQGRLS